MAHNGVSRPRTGNPPCSVKSTATAEREEKARAKKKELFIEELAKRGIVTHACKAAGISASFAYDWKGVDEEFSAAWEAALDEAVDRMEDEAYRRAVEGVDKPVYQRGEVVGYVREYSDSLLQTLLKGNRPEKYKDRGFMEITGKNGGPLQVTNLTDEELRQQAAAILARTSDSDGAGT